MTNKDALATQIAVLDAKMKADAETLKRLKAELVEVVGTEGDTIETTLATITVTRQTEDRNTGQVTYGLDTTTFLAQDARVRANLVKQGIVTETEKVTKGQAPTVKVKAK
ncbi:MAG: hypothetical protein CMB99_00310 [Flavobacteriaceae bacterium]|nr:hypothetical protein [Flavobacteriaceae bacterium]|tara:strand:- start:1394 stop:1723 length:330 start_codon:yes stop_codon:yes gene_type:complete